MLPYANTLATKYRNTHFYTPTGIHFSIISSNYQLGRSMPIVARSNAEHIAWV